MKNTIENTLKDLVGAFLYYDRKEDEELPRGEIEKAIANGNVSIDEICQLFRNELVNGLLDT